MTGTVAAIETLDLDATAAAVQATLDGWGVCFGAGAGRSPFVVDPVPRIVEAGDWRLLARGLAQRAEALAAFVADVHGERRIVADGVMPERVLATAEHYDPAIAGAFPERFGWVAGLDVVCDAAGRLAVLEDNMRTPSGLAYALAARAAVDAHLPSPPPPGRLDPAAAVEALGAMLRAALPRDPAGDPPAVALLSDGPGNSAWYEHRRLADLLGIALVVPDDLVRAGGRLAARDADGRARPLDVIYRRTDEDRLRDAAGAPTWIAELLAEPLAAGTLSVVNPFGTGVADDKLVHAYVEEMIRFYKGEQPILPSVPTYDLGDPEVLDEVFPRIGELVVKPRAGHGGEGVVICPRDSLATRDEVRRRVAADPGGYVAQEVVELSAEPTVARGRLEPRHVDLRPFVVGVGTAATALPLALTRVALTRGSLVVNSSRNGGAKDTWLMG
ncbi:MAG: circularly permuted type 2 ATP-grasp protein [Solirubrobacterales bacterium]|nr:circularly permuted type 2 ATP-grasp protein [Solirubrobacterales bacterium]